MTGSLFGSIFTTDAVAAATSDEAFVEAMLEVEAALVRVGADLGLVAAEAAEAVAACCDDASRFDAGELGKAGRLGANPVIPLVAALRQAVGGTAASAVHLGATSQDVLDSATMLVAKRASACGLEALGEAAGAAAVLAEAHRDSLQLARTLLQPALPTPFGLRAAGWLEALSGSAARLEAVATALPLQFGGAAGTLASLGANGLQFRRRLAAALGLEEPVLSWHTDRRVVAELAGALASAAGSCGKIARDVSLLMQAEIGEVAEPASPGRGASSTLPQKRNPVLSTAILADSRRTGFLAGTLFSVMDQELDRSPGGWQAEWEPLVALLRAAGGAAGLTAELVSGLEVDPDRMVENLSSTGGSELAERARAELAALVGPEEAAGLVDAAARGAAEGSTTFASALAAAIAELGSSAASRLDLDVLFDPAGYLGSAGVLVDLALEQYRQGRP